MNETMYENKNEKQPERYRESSGLGWKIALAVVALIVLIVANGCYAVTYENEYTLIKQFGKVEKIVSEAGLSFKLPFIQTTDTLPKAVQIYDLAASDVITEDKKTMVADSYVLWKIEDPKLFVQTLNSLPNAEYRMNNTVYNSIKAVISSMSQTDVISYHGKHRNDDESVRYQVVVCRDQAS